MQTLIEHGLVDAVHLFVFPQVLGSGGRVFRDAGGTANLHLTGVERVGEELVRLSYDVAH